MGRAYRTARALTVGLGLLAALAACTSEPEPQRPVGDGSVSERVVTELEAFEARIWGEIDPTEADPRLREAEEAIAACMAETGFEYHPQVPAAQYLYSSPLVMTREHAEQLGYGETIPPAPGVPPSRWSLALGQVPGERENLDYRASLSAEAQDAYWAALNGDAPPEDADSATPADFGCHGKVMADLYADAVIPEAFRDAETAIRQSWRALETEPRVVAEVERWTECMSEAGYPGLENRRDGVNVVIERANDFPAPSDMAYEELAEAFAAELADLQAFERSVALSDAECLESTDFQAAWDAARSQIHDDIVNVHRADLEVWATWAEEKRAARP